MPQIDAFDTRLLALMQRDARRTAQEMGDELGLSASAVQKRLRRLRREGLIAREVAILSPRARPDAIQMIVRVELARGRADAIPVFQARMDAAPDVTQCYHVTGDTDFVLIMSSPSMQVYDAFVQEHFVATGLVARFETSVVMRSVKVGFELPL